jgi:hypothetical protein
LTTLVAIADDSGPVCPDHGRRGRSLCMSDSRVWWKVHLCRRGPRLLQRLPRDHIVFFGSVKIDTLRPVRSFETILNSIVMELQRTEGAKVKLTLDCGRGLQWLLGSRCSDCAR